MDIRIVTDSTCDLPQKLLDRHKITVLPLYINFENQGYLDGVEMSREEFYNRLPEEKVSPTTATPGINAILKTYQQLADEGADHIISIHIGQALSATVDVVRQAAEQASIPVEVIDSGQLSMGVGFLALHAAEAAAEGKGPEEILRELDDLASRTHVFAALDTLDYLRRSGRMNTIVAGIGSLLHVKPILIMHQGKPTSELVRTQQRALDKVVSKLKELRPIQRLALVHSNAPQAAEELWEQARDLIPEITSPESVSVTPVLGSHIGPGAVGFALVRKKGT